MEKGGKMKEKLTNIIKKVCTKEIMFYAIFGVLTTVINLGVFYVLSDLLNWNENVSNVIAIIIAVLFAYFTNKDLVFHSEAKTLKAKWKEFAKFISGRAFTMVIEWVGGALLFLTPMPQMISKLIVTVVVVILNFFISKFFAFKKSKS